MTKRKRQPKTFLVRPRGSGHFYVLGLADAWGDEPDTMLLLTSRYPATEWPEVVEIDDADAMRCALYDLFQTHDGLRAGDRFDTPCGRFACVSFHVVDDAPTADLVSSLFDDDGATFETSTGESLDNVCRDYGATLTRTSDGKIRYAFADGSAIVELGAAWDRGYDAADGCFCWPAVGGHVPECAHAKGGNS